MTSGWAVIKKRARRKHAGSEALRQAHHLDVTLNRFDFCVPVGDR